MIKPKRLRAGDTIAAVSLSWGGPGAFPHRYEAGKKQLMEEFQLHVVESRHATMDPAWLARNPRARADDLMDALSDPSIAGIVSTIGGEDSIRLLPHVDKDVIRRNPKVFLGYSDSTVLHMLFFDAGVTSFYGPAIMAGFAENAGIFPYTIDAVRKVLFGADPMGLVQPNRGGWTVERLDWGIPENQQRRRQLNPSTGWRFLQGRGTVRGRLIGGCLEVLQFLRGTRAWPALEAFQGAILFLETSEEAPAPSVLARELRVYASMGILARLAAILLGRPGGSVPIEQFERYDRAVRDVVAEEEGFVDLPIVTCMDFGHTDPMFVLPYGVLASVDCDRKTFSIVERAVVD
jgi:muramoyltetrapeptide carboxypeptidase LdcA involved in peptidoglycan recycling